MSTFKEAYKKTCESQGAFSGSIDGDNYINNIDAAIDKAFDQISEIGKTNKGIHFVKGDIAEPWHAETAKIYATAKGLDNIKTKVPRDGSPVDIIAMSPGEFLEAQLKYYRSADDTVKAISNPKYDGLIKIVPSDQLEQVKEVSYRLYLENMDKRPEMAERYLNTHQQATDRLKVGGAESSPLTDSEALEIAKEIQKDNPDLSKHGLNTLNFVKWSDILRESGEAALNAAILTAVLKTVPHLLELITSLIKDGEINKDALKEAGLASLRGAGSGALRGGVAAAITSSCKAGLLGDALKSVNPSVVAAVTVVAMNAIHNAIGVYKGELTTEQFADACIKDAFVVSFGVIGAGIGQSIIPVPILGAVIGNLVGSVVSVFIYEGGKQISYSFFINSGISFFNIVKQDYTLPRDVLERCGCDLIELDEIELDTIELDTINLDTIELDTIGIKALKRGMISVNTVGYV